MHCSIVDVFAERPLTGNQLAIVRQCGHMDTATMQAVAREMNFSETAFVVEEHASVARVRIFTPAEELPFAGHPTLGTAWLLGRESRVYTLDLAVGSVPVSFDSGGIAWMQPPAATLGDTLPMDLAAELLGLSKVDVDPSGPCQYAEVGLRFVLIGVRTLDTLRRARVDTQVHAAIAGDRFLGVFAFAQPGYSRDADFAARMFFEANGWREDPATGSANAAFAACLYARGVTGEFTVEQGFEMARPSRVYLDVGDAIRVGGRVQPVLSGDLQILHRSTPPATGEKPTLPNASTVGESPPADGSYDSGSPARNVQ
ncbi:MAG: PhzF family phenazine biosynthesis protein [Gammaproteobacteria bacterium]|nr:PhzF family phenazine biosynthesis protein [Gammaproteobacteria bacterium]